MGKWKMERRCVGCHRELTWNQVMHSHGFCPRCGRKASGAGTIVRTRERAYRLERAAPWWKFWVPRQRVYSTS